MGPGSAGDGGHLSSWRVTASLCKLGLNFRAYSLRTVHLLTSWLRTPVQTFQQKRIKLCRLRSHTGSFHTLPHSLGYMWITGPPRFKGRGIRFYLLMGQWQNYVAQQHVGWGIFLWQALENTLCHSDLNESKYLSVEREGGRETKRSSWLNRLKKFMQTDQGRQNTRSAGV